MVIVVGEELDADQVYKGMRGSQAVSREARNPLLMRLSLDVAHPKKCLRDYAQGIMLSGRLQESSIVAMEAAH